MRTKSTVVVILLFICPVALATGDPAVIYYLAGALTGQIVMLAALVKMLRTGERTTAVVANYLAACCATWIWAWNSRIDPEFLVFIILVATPCLVAFAVFRLSRARRGRGD